MPVGEDPTLLHGFLVQQSEHELDAVQRIVRVAQDGFARRITLAGLGTVAFVTTPTAQRLPPIDTAGEGGATVRRVSSAIADAT